MKPLKRLCTKAATRDLVWGALAFFALGTVFVEFDVYERFYQLTREHENREVDELAVLAPVLALILCWYSLRRWFETHRLTKELNRHLNELDNLNQRFDLAANAGLFGFWACDFERQTVHWSKGQQDIYQISPVRLDDAIDNWEKNVDPLDQSSIKQLYDGHRGSREPLEYSFHLMRPNGEVRHIRSLAAAERDRSGKLLRLSGIDQDITDYTEMIDKLRLHSAAVEETSDGIMITGTAEKEYAIEYVNPAFESLTGYKSVEVIGRNPRFLSEGIEPQQQMELVHNAVVSGQNTKAIIKNRRKDGVEFWIELSISPVKDEENRIRNFVGVQHDITEREMARQQLVSYGEMLRAVSQVLLHYIEGEKDAPDIYEMLLSVFLDVTESPTGFIGTVEHTALGKPFLKICALSGISNWDPAWQKRMSAGPGQSLEFHNLDTLFGHVITSRSCVISNDAVRDPRAGGIPDGHLPLERFMGVPLWAKGSLVGVVGLANRITAYDQELVEYVEPLSFAISSILLSEREKADRSVAEERAGRSQKMDALGRLTGGLAHEYNNVLGGLQLNLDLALESAQNEKTIELLRRSIHILRRGSGLTHSLLAFSRRRDMKPVVLDLNSFVRELSSMLRISVGEDINLETSLHSSWNVKLDSSLLQSTILNLVLNSRDAIESRGDILIRTENITPQQMCDRFRIFDVHTDCVMLMVKDNGVGISETDLNSVFDPFFTSDDHGTRTGLGLSIVHGFVTQSGGRIWIESERHRGTAVRIVFPRTTVPIEHKATTQLPIVKSAAINSILIVEDRQEFGNGMAQLLESEGYTVEYASSGTQAFAALENGKHFDLVIADVMMPGGISGADVARRARETGGATLTLLVSGHDDEKLSTLLSAEEVKQVLRKPFGKRELLEQLALISIVPEKS